MTKQSAPLSAGWTVRLAGGSCPDDVAHLRDVVVPAQVPGCSHQDLLRAGHIADPCIDRNELEVRWIGRADWCYETELTAVPLGCERIDLVFEGLDTVATISIDGAGRLKPLYHELRRLYADRWLSLQVRNGARCLVVDNQGGQAWEGMASVRRMLVDGTVMADEVLPFMVQPHTVAVLPLSTEVGDFNDSERELLVQADRLAPSAQADRGLMTLLPGESSAVGISGLSMAELDLARLRAAIFCVNASHGSVPQRRFSV